MLSRARIGYTAVPTARSADFPAFQDVSILPVPMIRYRGDSTRFNGNVIEPSDTGRDA
jgi:hypothetical protein